MGPDEAIPNLKPHRELSLKEDSTIARRTCEFDLEDVLRLVLSLGTMIGISTLIIYYVNYVESLPKFGFAIDTVSTTSVNVSVSAAADVTADWNITFAIQNSDAYLYVHDITASISYRSEKLAASPLPYFYLSEYGRTKVGAQLSARAVRVENWVADAMVADQMYRRMIVFDVKLEAIMVPTPGVFGSYPGILIVDCKDVKIEFFDHQNSKSMAGGGGVLQGGPIKCHYSFTGGTLDSNLIREKTSFNSQVASS